MEQTKPKQVNLYEAKTQLSQLVKEAAAGAEIISAKAGEPKVIREPGQWKGQVWIADDFDTLPPDILAAFYGEIEDPMAPLRALLEEREKKREGE